MGKNAAKGVTGEEIWLDGKFVKWPDAQIHVLTHTLHYGLGVFEGIRCYAGSDGRSAVFRLPEHIRRLFDSAKINLMEIPYSPAELEEATLESLRRNGLAEGYIRPLVFIGDGAMGLHPGENAVRVAVIAWEWGKYLGDEGVVKGIRAKISTLARHHVNAAMTNGKTCGDYVNSILAKREALLDGFDEAIMLDTQGLVSECTGENIFLVRDRRITTPGLHSILNGITRASMIEIARDRGYEVVEGQITRDDLYIADEVFLTGTAAEVTPIREIDHRTIGQGSRGPVTEELQKAYFDAVTGRDARYDRWRSFL
ncbi:MAG: branched-chain amino acid transaminase [Deltaproteobacteria bacterium]|jgi:branched-chain amino acid aminotransferase|nr:branched-chain amino acid transaminase [Deltaproteobacteria bacterium]MBW2499931.1 branched-chain amino acid transaminase [Deltaproteobacteria bacterium]